MKRIIVFVGIVASIWFALVAQPVHAADPEGIRVEPLRNYPTLDRGSTGKGTLKLTNTTDKTQSVTMDVEIFSVANENYDYTFRDTEETKWIIFKDTNLKLRPNETKIAVYEIAVPGNAAPGGHYFSLLSSIDPPKDAEGVTEIRRIASLVYLEVSGDITRVSNLTDFSPPWFTLTNEVPADVYITNSGTSHMKARVQVTGQTWIDQLFRRPTQEFAVFEGTILPATLRKIPGELKLPERPGIYVLTANYSPIEGSPANVKRIVVYAPLWFLAIFVLTITAMVLITIRFMRPHVRHVKSKLRRKKPTTD